MPRISPEMRIGLRASATNPAMPSPNRTSAPTPFSGYPRDRDRDEHAGFVGRHQDHRVLEAEALVEAGEDRVDEPLEAVGAMDALGEVLHAPSS